MKKSKRKPDAEQLDVLRTLVEQLKCFTDASYAGMIRDVRLTWRFDPDQNNFRQPGVEPYKYSPDYEADLWHRYGKHQQIDIGPYGHHGHGSVLGYMMYEHAFQMMQRVQDQVDDFGREYEALASRW